MRLLKSYSLFASKKVRLCYFLILPILLLLAQGAMMALYQADIQVIECVMIFAAGIFFDQWIFGGSCSKEADRMDYLKTSVRGREVLEDALKGDCLFRLLLCIVVFGGSEVLKCLYAAQPPDVWPEISDAIVHAAGMVLVAYGVTTLCLIVSRYIVVIACNLFIMYLSLFLAIPLLLLHGCAPRAMILTAAGCAVASWGAIRNVLRKMENGYYDSRG